MTQIGTLRLKFPVSLPDQLLESFLSDDQTRRLTTDGQSYFQIHMLSYEEEDELGWSDQLKSWTPNVINEREIELQLEFVEPLAVSQGDENDKLVVMMEFKDFPDPATRQWYPALEVMTVEIPK